MYQGPLNEEVTSDNRLFLPDDAEATEARHVVEADFPGGDTTAALVVYHRPGGLKASDRESIRDQGRQLAAVAGVRRVQVPTEPASVSEDGVTAMTVVRL